MSVDNEELWSNFSEPLWQDLKGKPSFWEAKPLLAHYTSLEVVEQILKNEEVWFSNPFYMNDVDELKYGIENGAQYYINSSDIKDAFGSTERHEIFAHSIDQLIKEYGHKYLLDTYIFCLSEHSKDNTDGLLSMWRGYGGDGKGAALVLDASKGKETSGSPLVFAKVEYLSNEGRDDWFDKTAKLFANQVLSNDIPDDWIWYVTKALFERLKMFALFTKHDGFAEENEWRVVYMPEKDDDGKLSHMLSYHNGPSGVEPKLKFKIAPVTGVTSDDLSLIQMSHSILLGPSISGRLSLMAVQRMLKLIKKDELIDSVIESSIPYRSN